MDMNLIIIEGIIDKVEYKETDVNKICYLDVKSERFFPDKNESKKVLFRVVVHNRLAEICNRYLEKGSHVLISGILTQKTIEGKEVKFLPKAKNE